MSLESHAEFYQQPAAALHLQVGSTEKVRTLMKQQALYERTKAWLESRGFRTKVTGDGRQFVIPIRDLFSAPYKVPDLVGVDVNGRIVIAEVEVDKDKFFDALGRCMLWRCMATFVYVVYPKGRIPHAPFLSKVGVGLLEVDEGHVVAELVKLPEPNDNLFSLMELHPTDFGREQQLAAYIRDTYSHTPI